MKAKTRKRKGHPDLAILADVIKRIVDVADPEKIVLFGSAARGTMGPDSDLDLLVIPVGIFVGSTTLPLRIFTSSSSRLCVAPPKPECRIHCASVFHVTYAKQGTLATELP
ncbi:MAG: nucleotidyltransferase domain-containing protein [Gemmataceae bacterium]|nr:nucleotidyltransferase domain-containing protein [Gemmataceae bacterium]